MLCSGGLLNILKPPGMTSHDVVTVVRRIMQTKRCGHGGTLDPAAVGVLPVFFGDGTKLIEYYQRMPKSYLAEIIFGQETDTYDYTGRMIKKIDFYELSPDTLHVALTNFIGDIRQVPPMYSAVKIAGKKLYEFARQGVEIERQPREVKIYDIKVVRIECLKGQVSRAVLDVACSPGTYIRSLCHDLGHLLGCGAVMGFLIRTRSHGQCLADAVLLDELKENPWQYVLPAWQGLGHLESVVLQAVEKTRFCNGMIVPVVEELISDFVLVRDIADEVIGVGRKEGCFLKPVKVFCKK
jgi:tRNA pseudouridine55 synthase